MRSSILVVPALLLALVPSIAWADDLADCAKLVASPYETDYRDTGHELLGDVDIQAAEAACLAAVEADPDSMQARTWQARIHYYFGEYQTALDLLEPAAKAKNPYAQQMLGDILIDGLGGIPVDEARALDLLKASAAAGFAPGQNSLGVSYERGQGVAVDMEKAAEYYGLAAKQGMPTAQVNLGILYTNGTGVKEDDARAAELFRSAAESGDASGMNSLGVSYELGEGIEQDYALAMDWYRKAAEGGSAIATANVGNLYLEGLGVPVDQQRGLKWVSKSASADNSYGKFLLAGLYEEGVGIDRDLDYAIELYRQAAELGSTSAEDALIRLGKAQ